MRFAVRSGFREASPMKIRTKLLLTMAGLLVLSGGLSLALQLWDSHQLRAQVRALVEDAIRRVVDEREPGGYLAEERGRAEPRGSIVLRPGRPTYRISRGPDGEIEIVIERHLESLYFDDELERPPPAVIPPSALEAKLLGTFRDPVVDAVERRLPRQLLISASVLGAGLLLVGVLGAGSAVRSAISRRRWSRSPRVISKRESMSRPGSSGAGVMKSRRCRSPSTT